MKDDQITPEKITKPIQLLAAWLAGLVALDSCFLVAAAKIGTDTWQSGILVVAATLNVPIFLAAVFLLQTKFRPELQEDSYYSSYLSNKTNEVFRVKHDESNPHIAHELINHINLQEKRNINSSESLKNLLFGINQHLSDRDTIREKLSQIGIIHGTLFGSDTPPTSRNISISQYLQKDIANEVIGIGKELGFTSYNYYDPYAEDSREDVLLGSYGKGNYLIL
ncbi:hypothetical protein [Aeromonas enteropelogenes]|uniref:hypothetical protein n=1 Tax=Aeromonas enteropelogenes TaxID=29489 RepID=UPI003BA0FD27